MAIQIADGFQLRVAKPLDDRQNVETVAQLDPTYGYEGQIVYVKDIKKFYTCYKDENGSLAYKVMETEYDDTEIQEELDTKLDKEKVVQNLDAPDVESVLSTEALNTVLNNKLDKSDGSSLVPDTEIAKIHEHVNQDVLDKLSDDGNGNLLYDSNLISVNEMMTVIELNNFLDTLEIDGVGYVPSTTP